MDTVDRERLQSLTRFKGAVSHAVEIILQSLSDEVALDSRGPNFVDTPRRVAAAYAEIFAGLFDDGDGVKRILSKTFPAKSAEMVTVGPIEVWSMCPHHLLPVRMSVYLAYIPSKKVLGLSKLARLAELIAKKPALQEDTTAEIAGTMFRELKPKGVACLIRGRHLCMEMRGVKKAAWTTTTALEGVFKKPEVRAEFLAGIYTRGER
jgi:GTP cyclohydrolase I